MSTAIPRSSIPAAVEVMSQAFFSLFELTGGDRAYGLDCTSHSVRGYLPPPTAGTRLTFFRACAASAYTARISAKTGSPIQGSTTDYIELVNAGDAVELVPDADLANWLVAARRQALT